LSATSNTVERPADRPAGRGLVAALFVLLAYCWPVPAQLQTEGRFEVLSAYPTVRDGVYYVDAKILYDLPTTADEALRSGVTLTLELQIEVERLRRFPLPDKSIASLRQRYALQYHALSDRYIVQNLNSGEQETYSTLGAAEAALGEVHELPVIDAALIEPGAKHQISMRAVLDIRRLPVPLRLFAFIFDDWRVTSQWYRWRFERAN
jgi:Domain of unknown function (DUF4390)